MNKEVSNPFSSVPSMMPELEAETKPEQTSLFGSANLKTALKFDKESSSVPEKTSGGGMFGSSGTTGGGLFGSAGVIPESS